MFSFQGETKEKPSPSRTGRSGTDEFDNDKDDLQSLDKASKMLKKTNNEARGEEDTQLLREVFHNLGQTDSVNPNQEISALGFNESQFQGIGDDSQFNDVLDISAFQKKSILEKYEDFEDTRDEGLMKRNRLPSEAYGMETNEGNRKSDFSKPGFLKSPNNIFNQPQNFPEIDASAIGVDALHVIDNEFGDGSFINPDGKTKAPAEKNEGSFEDKVNTVKPQVKENDKDKDSEGTKMPDNMRFSLTGEKTNVQKDKNELESSGTFGQDPDSPEKLQPDNKEITAFGKQLSKITGKKTSPVVQKRLSGNLSDYDPTNPDQDPTKQENF